MAVYQNSTANLGVKLEITHASPDIANNRTTITYKAYVYKTGSHNPWNALSQTPMYLTINGQSLHSTAAGNYDLRGGTTSQLIKSGTLTIPHNADGSKSFTFSWNVNFTSTGYGYGNVTTSGTYVLPNIARASTFTIPSTTITTGSAFTVTIARASDSFTHKVSYIVGSSESVWTSSATTSYSATVPHSLFNSHKSTASVSGVIRVTTMNGSVEVGSNQRTVTINLTSSALPSLGTIGNANSNSYVFTSDGQFIRGMSRLTCTANSASGSYSSSISAYEFRVLRANGTTTFGTTSKTSNTHQFPAFDFPNSSSEVVTPQVRVKDSRGRYSAWKNAAVIRVHYYAPPAIGTMTVRRTGSGNTTLQVTRNYSISLLYQGGAGSNLNTASLWFQHRTKGSTTVTNNTGAKSTTTSLTNSNANLAGTFAANTSYEVRAILDDAIAGRVIGSWISVGTEFVPMDIGPKGVGVGKIHSDGSADLEVGSGGISVDGVVDDSRQRVFANVSTEGWHTIANLSTGRAYGTFIVTDTTSGKHNVASFIASQTYGKSSINLLHGQAYGTTPAINHVRILYNTSDRVYGGGKLQIHTSGSATIQVDMWQYNVYGWSGWKLTPPTYESTPSGWGHDASAYVTNITQGVNKIDMRYGVSLNAANSFLQVNTDYGYVAIGPRNSSHSHIYTDAPNFYFNKELLVNGSQLAKVSQIPTNIPTITSGTNANGNWYNINGVLLICWYRFSITGKLTNSQMNGSWTYPMPFAFAPAVSIGSRADSDTNSTNGYRRAGSTAFHQYNESATKTDILYAVNNADVPASPQKFLNIFAMGTPA